MKPVFKCDYCTFMGTKEEVEEHEVKCTDNYYRKSCYTCTHKSIKTKDGQWYFECEEGIEIPAGKIWEFCELYHRKENTPNTLTDIFGGLFGGF